MVGKKLHLTKSGGAQKLESLEL